MGAAGGNVALGHPYMGARGGAGGVGRTAATICGVRGAVAVTIFRALRASAAVPFFRRCTWPQLHWHAAVLCTVCVTVVPVRGSWCTNTLSTISRGARCGETPVLPSILSDRVTAGSRDFVVIERIVKHDEY